MDKKWSAPALSREQHVLFSDTLDEIVPAHHAIRLLDALLEQCDWTAWEARYDGHRGQPPIHPRLMAGCILYGLLRNIRSSRQLEDATRERKDFLWFLEGRTIDHSSFAKFRTSFATQLKDLNRQIARGICELTKEAFEELVLDATRERANSDRHGARTAASIERIMEGIVANLNAKLDEMARIDKESGLDRGVQTGLFDEKPAAADTCAAQSPARECETGQASGGAVQTALANAAKQSKRLEREIDRLRAKQRKLQEALDAATKRDAAKKKIEGQNAKPVRVPLTDPESFIQPNKDGGFAPNYTPAAAVDSASGAILYEDVVPGADENAMALPAIAQAQAIAGAAPQRVLADGNALTGETMRALEDAGIEVYTPAGGDLRDSNPANRPAPREPVPESQSAQLPRRGRYYGQAAFQYDAQNDCYYCPAGKTLLPTGNPVDRDGRGFAQKYTCPGKTACPHCQACTPESTPARTVVRDEYQDARDEIDRRMATPEGEAIYKRRAPAIELVFARIKQQMGIRQFLLRGLAKVRMEWSWICGAYNLKILMRLVSGGGNPLSNGSNPPHAAPPTGGNCVVEAYRRVAWRGEAQWPLAA